jgi:hypothetical protein
LDLRVKSRAIGFAFLAAASDHGRHVSAAKLGDEPGENESYEKENGKATGPDSGWVQPHIALVELRLGQLREFGTRRRPSLSSPELFLAKAGKRDCDFACLEGISSCRKGG